MVIGNAFGLLIASAGLLGGVMVSQRSLDFWLDDILPITFVVWMSFRLYRSFLATMAAYPDLPPKVSTKETAATSVTSEPVIAGQITSAPPQSPPPPSPEQVVEEVARRIEAKKKTAEKKNNSSSR